MWKGRGGIEADPKLLGISGLGRICKKCTSLRTWSIIGARGDIGLRLRISRRGYNCVVCVIFVLFTMQSFTTHVILVALYTHTYTLYSICFFPGCFGAGGLTESSLSIPRGRGKVRSAKFKKALHAVVSTTFWSIWKRQN
ncbi:hypothetical protein Hanom_Chr15g01405901 [Helianthus anomalus]